MSGNEGKQEKEAMQAKAGQASSQVPDFDNPMGLGDTSLKHDLQGNDHWPLEAERMAQSYPLIESLKHLAGHFGRRTSIRSLIAGLPIAQGVITPKLFIRAAQRADLSATLSAKSIGAIAMTRNFPCLLVLKDQQACILWGVRKKGRARIFLIQFPETPDEKKVISQDNLEEIYGGYAFFVRPVMRSDDRAGPSEIDTEKSWFWSAIQANAPIYRKVAMAAVIINLLALASPLFMMNVYDRVIPNQANDTLLVLVVGVLIAFAFDFILKSIRAYFLDFAGRRADIKISARLYEQIMGMTMLARPSSAGVLASHMREFESLRDFFTSATLAAFIDLPFVLLYIGVIAIIGGPMAFVPLSLVPILMFCGYLMHKPLQAASKQSMNESALKNAHLFETITGLETLKVQAAEGHAQRQWEELTEKASITSVRMKVISMIGQNFTAFCQQSAGILIVIVGYLLIQSEQYDIAMGALIACVMLNGRALAPIGQISALISRYTQTRQSYVHLSELMAKPVERPAGKHFIPMPDAKGHVEFRDVTFKYPKQTIPAIANLSIDLPVGSKVGIIGAVGSGKTTLSRLLMNLYEPETGSIQIDGTDVRQIDPGDLRRSIGVVQQSAQLFYGSVRENITMGHETAPDSAVLRAAEISGVMDFLGGTETGLDTQVGERGEALSGGQRQAIAVARALLYDPPILIMDEPTASVDPGSENRLKARLKKLTEGRTVIVITHKGGMLDLVDQVALMDKGQLIAFGPRDEVIKKLQERQIHEARSLQAQAQAKAQAQAQAKAQGTSRKDGASKQEPNKQ